MSQAPPSPWQKEQLPGGLPLIWQERSGPDIVAARLCLRGGSSVDPPGQRGAHQLLAGLLTRGCGNLDADQLADLVEGCGAVLRTEANEDNLVLSLKCTSSDAPELVPLLTTMVTAPSLDQDQLSLEKQLNLQSLQRQQEDPFQLAHDQLREQLYGHGPYGHDPLGIESELATLTRSNLTPLVEDLGREGGVMVLTGTISPALQASLRDELERLPLVSQAPEPTAGPGARGSAGFGHQEQDTEQIVLMVGCATVPLGHPDAVALRLLQTHLGFGMSSRLFVVMREERGLAYDVGVHFPARRGAAPLVWHLSSSLDRAKEASDSVMEEWLRMLETPITPAELSLAKAKYLGQDAMGRQTCGQIADRQALVLSHGLPDTTIQDCLARAEELTAQDVLEAAQRWLHQPSMGVCGPAQAVCAAEQAWHRQFGSQR